MTADRYDRHLSLLGEAGQRRLAGITIGLVGAGGLGMHVAQQTAYEGVTRYRICEFDTVDITNLNRLVGAGPADIDAPKLGIAERLIKFIQPDADVLGAAEPFDADGPTLRKLFDGVDVIFSCVDTEAARVAVLDYAATHGIPLLDLATDTGEHDGKSWYGGRVVVATGEGCPVCLDVIDQQALAVERMTAEQRLEHARIYGIPLEALDATGPSVISINGVVASLAVTEFTAMVTGLRTPARLLTYRGERGIVNVAADVPDPGCYYCTRYRAAHANGNGRS